MMRYREYESQLPGDFKGKLKLPKDPDTQCWGWEGSKHPNGYALYRRGRGSRFVLSFLVGPPPQGKPWALHSCDNPPCVNPNHLRWGSPQENTDDMFERNRSSNGGRSTQTHCKNGHTWDDFGFFHDRKGVKICKECRRESFKSWSHRMKDPDYIPPRKKQYDHGTLDGYRWGCRCDKCRLSKALYNRDLTQRKLGDFPKHGTSTSYTRGCRCSVCKQAKSDSDKAYRARRKGKEQNG